ncbi:MAG TPA: hypothetical protein VGH28_32015 [Polyangiaceae bacterium]|jgi:hypothetical protein
MRVVTIALACAFLLAPGVARADAAACVAASDEGQKDRDAGHLIAARVQFAMCAHEECPSLVRTDCLRWLEEVDKRTPTVIPTATVRGKDAVDVAVVMDGVPLASRLEGRAIPVDPGEHRLRFRHPPDQDVDEVVVIKEGDKDRVLQARFGPEPSLAVVEPAKKPPTLAYVFTGIAVGSALAAAAFGAVGLGFWADCNGNKSKCDVNLAESNTRVDWVVSDVSVGIALVSTALAIWQFVRHGQSPRAKSPFFPGGLSVRF